MTFCHFCQKEVGLDHIQICPKCGSKAHKTGDKMECETCGTISPAPKRIQKSETLEPKPDLPKELPKPKEERSFFRREE